jgi:hypothetical protein
MKIYHLYIGKLILENEICLRIKEVENDDNIKLNDIIDSGFLYDTKLEVFCSLEKLDEMKKILKKRFLESLDTQLQDLKFIKNCVMTEEII